MAFSGDNRWRNCQQDDLLDCICNFFWLGNALLNPQPPEFQLETFNLKVSEHYRRAESLPQVTLRLPQRPAS